MNLNPFSVELNNLLKKKNDLVEKLENTKSDLEFFETLNYNTLLFDINALEEKILNVKNELKKIDQEKIGYNFQLISIMNNKIISSSRVMMLLKALKPYSKEDKEIMKTLEIKIGELEKSKKEAEIKFDKYNLDCNNKKTSLDFMKNFDLEKNKALFKLLDNEISNIKQKIDETEQKKDEIDIVLYPFTNEINEILEQKNIIEDEVAYLEKAAYDLEKAMDGYERKIIHEDVQERFDDGNPSKIMERKKRKLVSLNRTIEKIKLRAENEIKKQLRIIHTLIIDGNNLCHGKDDKFIGLNVLNVIMPILCGKYKVIIVFDASILRTYRYTQIQNSFSNEVEVHIANDKADETILNLVDDETTFVLSNDKFKDFFDKKAVKNDQILSFKMIDDKVLIDDLDIVERY